MDKYIIKRYKSLHYNLNNIQNPPNNLNLKKQDYLRSKKVFLPYHKYLSNNINHNLKSLNVTPINLVKNKLNDIIVLGKDKTNTIDKPNIVYKLNCKDCSSCCIGQSKRFLGVRVNEHKKDTENGSEYSAISNHCNSFGHHFNFEKPTILDTEPFFKKREFSEMLNIHFHDNTINRIQDTQYVKNIYKNIIKFIKNQ